MLHAPIYKMLPLILLLRGVMSKHPFLLHMVRSNGWDILIQIIRLRSCVTSINHWNNCVWFVIGEKIFLGLLHFSCSLVLSIVHPGIVSIKRQNNICLRNTYLDKVVCKKVQRITTCHILFIPAIHHQHSYYRQSSGLHINKMQAIGHTWAEYKSFSKWPKRGGAGWIGV